MKDVSVPYSLVLKEMKMDGLLCFESLMQVYMMNVESLLCSVAELGA